MRLIALFRRGVRRLADVTGRLVRGGRRLLGGALRVLGAALTLLLVGAAAAVAVAAGIAVVGALALAGVLVWLAGRLGGVRGPGVDPDPDPITV